MMKNENVAYCGLYCAECPNHTGVIADLARDLRKQLRNFRFDKTAEILSKFPFFKEYKKYNDCYCVLGAMVKMRCGKTCREGGGNPGCRIRSCAIRKKYEGCWDCDTFETCEKLAFLKTNHGVAHIKNLRIINKKGLKEFESGPKLWYQEK
ncbi:MAG: DUF3795 domain-containing protein [Bacteroidetes bacterium]|nr:DUF3795 domain-containing protein [Bacteroidota bacterium]